MNDNLTQQMQFAIDTGTVMLFGERLAEAFVGGLKGAEAPTLRDLFAAIALLGTVGHPTDRAERAYEIACAMMDVRARVTP